MTKRLLSSYFGLALLILILLETPLAVLVYRYERGLAASQAERVATAVAIAAGEDFEHGRIADLRTITARYRAATGGEVEIVGANGQTVANSDPDHDNDARGQDAEFVADALKGASVDSVISDEGQPQAVSAVPIGGDGSAGGVVLLGLPATTTISRVHEIWLGMAGFAALVLTLTAILGLWMARSLAQPLGRLQQTVDTLGRSDLSARAETDDGPPEIRELARQFNEMAGRLSELIDAQTRFVADASHQLRSPLTALRLRLENLELDATGHAADTVVAAGREVQRLSRLVDGLLTLGQAEGTQPERHPVDLVDVIEQRCLAWAAYAAERQIEIRRNVDPARTVLSSMVPGDLEQILDNLLANALDASPMRSVITADLASGGRGSVEIHLVDQGPGMTESERRHAFDRFWQGSTTGGGHSGLGLAIVRQLAIRNQLEVELRPAEAGGLDAVIQLKVISDHPNRRARATV
jgi:signal transduction histidine kinase